MDKKFLMIRFTLIVFALICSGTAFAQDDDNEYDPDYEFPESTAVDVDGGIGLGIDYGGIGLRLSVLPIKYFGVFGSVGYNFNGAGYNGGVIAKFRPEKKVRPYVSAMYGYNAVILVDGLASANKTYFGASLGLGINLKMKSENFWSFGLVVPFKSKEYQRDYDVLDSNPNIEMTEPLPVQISVGFHRML